MIAVPLMAIGNNKNEIFKALGIDGADRESQACDVDLYESAKGKEVYRSFVTYFDAQKDPVEFHDPEEINPSTIAYQINFLRKYYQELIEKENKRESFVRSLQKWKTQTLIDLVLKVGFIKEWNKSKKNEIPLTVLHSDLVHAVEGERQMFLSIPKYISEQEDHALLKLLAKLELNPVLYDEMLIYLRGNDYNAARLLDEESTARIEKMDILNQRIYGIMWPSWQSIFNIIEGATGSQSLCK